MLEPELIEQLKSVFSKLEQPVVLRTFRSTHPNQAELGELLQDLASASDKIQLEETDRESDVPRFELVRQGRPNGVSFRGVPGGHEFSSLVLSILYSDEKGKQPDAGITRRIRSLKGPIRLRTYVSLSCENCPEVVQVLNLMATLHPDFHHEMVDGAMAQAEVESLGLQGVPAVVADSKLIHSGKIQFLDLLAKLESTFGTTPDSAKHEELGLFDVVVLGGGPAGASAAIYSARKGQRTAIVAERFGGQLLETKGIENMISVPYTEGAKLAAQLNQHVLAYPVEILEHRRVSRISAAARAHRIELESGESLEARTVIIATGAKWRTLGIPGEKEHLGLGVAFCAHCDGPFYKNRKVAVIGGGNSGVEAAIDLAGIAREVILLEYADSLKADRVLIEKLKALPNASIVTSAKSTRVLGDGRTVQALEYQDRKTERIQKIDLEGVFVQIGLLPNSQFLKGTLELTPTGEIVVDSQGRTSLPGVYAAGDVTTTPFKQIVIAMGEGAKAALTAFQDRLITSTP